MPDLVQLKGWLSNAIETSGEATFEQFCTVGAALHQAGELTGALVAFEAAAAMRPHELGIWHAQTAVCLDLGNAEMALEKCQRALGLAPADHNSLFNAAVVYESLGKGSKALAQYEQLLRLAPAHPGALLNRVPLLVALGEKGNALRAGDSLVKWHPKWANAWFNRGEAYTSSSLHEEALRSYQNALSLDGSYVNADIAAGVAEAALGKLQQATGRLERIRQNHPEAFSAFRSPLEMEHGKHDADLDVGRIALLAANHGIRLCDWNARDRFVELFDRVVEGDGCRPLNNPELLFLAISLPIPESTRFRAARQVAGRIEQGVGGALARRLPNRVSPRLRIGYLSGNFGRRPTAWILASLFERHDRKQFEVLLYATSPEDGSEHRSRIARAGDCFRDLSALDDEAVAQQIADDGIDILVDLAGYMLYHRAGALARRPAPIQVSYLGFIASTGAPWVDYAILDHTVLSETGRQYWSEAIAYLPSTMFFCDDARARPTAESLNLSREQFGLPESGVVFCCLNASWKIDSMSLDAWSEILRRLPGAVIWLLAEYSECATNLRQEFVSRGVARERVIFAQPVEQQVHQARFGLADVFLDTFACNAVTTCMEAMEAGLPLVTMLGSTVISRVASSLMLAHGMADMVAKTPQDYIGIACKLASDRVYRQAVAVRMAATASHAYNSELRVREFEQAYLHMWEQYRAGRPAADFDVAIR